MGKVTSVHSGGDDLVDEVAWQAFGSFASYRQANTVGGQQLVYERIPRVDGTVAEVRVSPGSFLDLRYQFDARHLVTSRVNTLANGYPKDGYYQHDRLARLVCDDEKDLGDCAGATTKLNVLAYTEISKDVVSNPRHWACAEGWRL